MWYAIDISKHVVSWPFILGHTKSMNNKSWNSSRIVSLFQKCLTFSSTMTIQSIEISKGTACHLYVRSFHSFTLNSWMSSSRIQVSNHYHTKQGKHLESSWQIEFWVALGAKFMKQDKKQGLQSLA